MIYKENSTYQLDKKKILQSLSSLSGGGEVVVTPPFGFSLVPFLLRLPYGPFTHPLSRYPCIYENNFQKFLP